MVTEENISRQAWIQAHALLWEYVKSKETEQVELFIHGLL